MFKAQLLYQGRKPDITELEAVFPQLEPKYQRLTGKLKASPDPFYKIKTLDWPWFRSRFDAGYNIRCIILKAGELKAAGVKGHNGFYNLDTDGIHDFYVTDIQKPYQKATKNGFKTALAYMVVHEFMHGVRWLETGDRLKAVKDVHDWVAAGTLKLHFGLYIASLETDNTSREEQSGVLESLKAKLTALLSKLTAPPALLHPLQLSPRVVTQPYGVQNAAYKLTGRHIGTDYRAPLGTKLVAPYDGQVTTTGTHPALGFFLHYEYTYLGQKYEERWCHLKELPFTGAYNRGEVMAVTGNTGMSTGPHLHREVWYDDVRTDLINKTNWSAMTRDPESHL